MQEVDSENARAGLKLPGTGSDMRTQEPLSRRSKGTTRDTMPQQQQLVLNPNLVNRRLRRGVGYNPDSTRHG